MWQDRLKTRLEILTTEKRRRKSPSTQPCLAGQARKANPNLQSAATFTLLIEQVALLFVKTNIL